MMTNLFESFDPMSSQNYSINYFSLYLFLIFLPYSYWLIPSRYSIMWMNFIDLLYNEFKLISSNKYQSNIILFLNLLMYIMLLNLLALFPYIFSITSHMSFNLSLSLILWMSFFIYSMHKTPMNFLSHLVPLNTPFMLINFMVLIELISNIIRPLTLAIRLTANLIAGHLLMILLGTFISKFIYLIPLTIMIQNMLLILELFMSFIQAYVFSMLSILYFSESKK